MSAANCEKARSSECWASSIFQAPPARAIAPACAALPTRVTDSPTSTAGASRAAASLATVALFGCAASARATSFAVSPE
jgi:hypothetical protein